LATSSTTDKVDAVRTWALPFLLLLAGTVSDRAQTPQPLSRDAALLNAFEIMCNLDLPDFDHIEAHATAMRMKLQSSSSEPSAGNTFTRSKNWVGGLTSGPFFLFDDEMSGSKGVSTACAVGGPAPDVNAFRIESETALKLSSEPEPEFGADGSRSFVWTGAEGPGTTLIIRDLTPSGRPGVMIKLLLMKPRA